MTKKGKYSLKKWLMILEGKMAETTLTLSISGDLKVKLETYSSKRGQSLIDTAYYLLNRGFENEDDDDPDYDDELFNSSENQAVLAESIKQANEGKLIGMTMKELKALAK